MAWDLGTGLTVIRDGLLVAGAGAITSVPLGRDVKVIATYELANEAADIFKRHDPDFDVDYFPVIPVGLQVGSRRFIRYRGRFEADGYEMMVMHGSYPVPGGRQECVAIARTEACHSSSAIDTAFLLDLDDLTVE